MKNMSELKTIARYICLMPIFIICGVFGVQLAYNPNISLWFTISVMVVAVGGSFLAIYLIVNELGIQKLRGQIADDRKKLQEAGIPESVLDLIEREVNN